MTKAELTDRQAWPLAQKIDHSLGVLDQFISRMDGKVYVAFSGGKDSTVVMHLAEVLKPDIKCVYVNTGCESPDVVHFVRRMIKAGHNIEVIRPKLRPREVWAQYGFPLVSKQQAFMIDLIRKNPNSASAQKALGNGAKTMFKVSDKFRYLIDAPYHTSAYCCTKLKKDPSHRYERETGLRPITGIMASESVLREKKYIQQGGCNSFAEGKERCQPLSIWTDDDIWQFIRERNIEIADIYHKGVDRTGCVGCGFGCQFPDDTRLATMYRLYPKYYEHVLNFTNNGVTYRQALREMLAVNGLQLPDESNQLTLF